MTYKQGKEVFLGSLRCEVAPETEKALREKTLDHVWDNQGIRFFHYKDGSVEIRTWKELIDEGLTIINGGKKLGV